MSPLLGDESGRFAVLRSTVDGDRLKRVGVVTYFSVYFAIALGGWRTLVEFTQELPLVVRPPALARLHVLLGLPRSVAWGLVSLSATVLAMAFVVSVQCYRVRRDGPPSLADIGDRSWRSRVPTGREVRDRLPDVPGPSPRSDDAGSDVRVHDASLAVPATPLTLPEAGPGARRSVVAVPESHAVAEGVPELAASPVSGADADGSERADGGQVIPIPDVLDPEETLGRATPAEGGGPVAGAAGRDTSDAIEEGPDAEASWPQDWRSGEDL